MKKLVAYFSAGGVTKTEAERLANAVGADLFEIKPVLPYTRKDLDWTDRESRSSIEMNDPDSRPEIAVCCEHMSDYDKVYIGFPIWWYAAPRIIESFLESYNFSGKTLIPFATSGGSGMGKTVEVLKKVCPNAIWKSGGIVNRMTESELTKWAEKQ